MKLRAHNPLEEMGLRAELEEGAFRGRFGRHRADTRRWGQQALLLAWDGGNALIQRALCGIIAEAWRNTAVIVLVRDDDEEFEAVDVLRQVGIPRRAVTFLALPHDSVWTRDYGPAIVRSSGGSLQVVDVDYQRGERPNDDELPPLIGPQLELPTVRAPLNLEGGNLISNGAGLCLTTMKLLEQNADRGYGDGRDERERDDTRSQLSRGCRRPSR